MVRYDFAAVFGHEHEILQPTAAEAGAIETGLDGDAIARHECIVSWEEIDDDRLAGHHRSRADLVTERSVR